jgi:hypothetical protein
MRHTGSDGWRRFPSMAKAVKDGLCHVPGVIELVCAAAAIQPCQSSKDQARWAHTLSGWQRKRCGQTPKNSGPAAISVGSKLPGSGVMFCRLHLILPSERNSRLNSAPISAGTLPGIPRRCPDRVRRPRCGNGARQSRASDQGARPGRQSKGVRTQASRSSCPTPRAAHRRSRRGWPRPGPPPASAR